MSIIQLGKNVKDVNGGIIGKTVNHTGPVKPRNVPEITMESEHNELRV